MPEWLPVVLNNLPDENDDVLAIDAEGNIGIGSLLVAGMESRDWVSRSVEDDYGVYCYSQNAFQVVVYNVAKYIPVEAFRNDRG
jgi:hypothetical protein